MSDRAVRAALLLVALALAGLSALTSTLAHGKYLEFSRTGDFTYWISITLWSVPALLTGLATLGCLLGAWDVETPKSRLKDSRRRGVVFRDHPEQRLRRWARSMRYFRFISGPGGMLDHPDRLSVVLKAKTHEEIEHIFATLGVAARPLRPDPSRDDTGQLAFSESAAAASGGAAPESPEPGLIMVSGVLVHVFRTYDQLQLSISDQPRMGGVTQAAVDMACKVETLLQPLAGRVADPPQDNNHCVCPKFYPSFWRDA